MCCALASVCARLRAARITDAPASASACAAAAPMPRLAPVTIATLPARSGIALLLPHWTPWLPVSILPAKQAPEGMSNAEQRDVERDLHAYCRNENAFDARR